MNRRLIVYLDESILVKDLVGGKAFNLAKLKRKGFNIPNAFVITTEAEGEMTEELKDLIFKNLNNLKTQKFAVRSSATCEDARFTSFAGQFESYLVVSQKDLIKTTKKCWASITKERVLTYCKYHNISPSAIKMAVIIQEMIFAEKGGVVFTRDVFWSNKDTLMIEAAKGLGEKIVSGLVNPERIMVSKKTRGVIEKQSPNGEVLTEGEIKRLVSIALKIETFCHSAQDIEWAIMDDKIYILQSRVITG